MDRRLFLKNTGQASLALSLAGLLPLDDLLNMDIQAKGQFFKLSLAQWSLHKAILESKTLNPLDFAKKAKELGFDAVEYVNQLYTIDQANVGAGIIKLIKELKTRSSDNGVKNVLIMIDGEGELAALTKANRDDAIAKHSRWVDAAAELGCHSIRVNLFGLGAENDFAVWKETSVDGLGRLAQYAAKSKINVIVENHGGLSSDAGKLTDVIRTIGLKNCGTLPDFGNFCVKRQGGERWGAPCIDEYDKYKGVLELMPFAHGVSAKTFDFDAAGNETTIDYFKMLGIVKKAGYTGHIGVEYEGSRLGEEEGIKATKALLLKAAAQLK
ncbi:sugar phosphate isomerase/epimerase family protein [Flavobacterium subsaxonicum]|uniref:Xylose isomerase n=1 Tax=Flavobacterium subsaxonicum WB 4.1-42 = DSM 21790 TaxID=1121898 RepID=A0A0A2MPX7_9FLAO|nr:sugar phosphate isomerase/epimerase family protein [Flavobacterium subsaxonicum]KGO93528.1 xylose isomerase [Flavobacterium subsaxonicum WB 4.1-42 = DSM 21790]